MRTLIAAFAVLALTLTACGGQEKDSDSSSSTPFNDADVAFATDMIPHHAQALAMVDTTWNQRLDPEVAQLRDDILDAQQPEVETMAGWLEGWGKPVPETGLGHDMGAMSDHSMKMPGMMSDEAMASLKKAHGAEFQRMWLEMMREHHQGAVTMAQDEIDEGKFPKAVALARSIVKGQTAEIQQIERLLNS
jgi:uncharacterized protein (DUF305 family)